VSFAYFPLYTGDYLRDTRALSPQRHGIYLLLLMHSWDTKGPLPLDEQEIAGIANCRSGDEIESLRAVLARYWIRAEDGWYNERCQLEIERSEALSRKLSEAGRKGYVARLKRLKRNDIQALAKPGSSQAQALASIPIPIPIPIPGQENLGLISHFVEPVPAPAKEKETAGAGRPGPVCPVERIIELWNSIVAAAGGQRVLNVSAERRKRICRRWSEVGPESIDEGLEWFRDLFRDHIAASKFATGRQPARDGRTFRIGIDSALRSEQSVDQILEGKYA